MSSVDIIGTKGIQDISRDHSDHPCERASVPPGNGQSNRHQVLRVRNRIVLSKRGNFSNLHILRSALHFCGIRRGSLT